MISINYDKCCWKGGRCTSSCCGESGKTCEGCVEACPTGALKREDIIVFDPDKCTSCGVCIAACEHSAITSSK